VSVSLLQLWMPILLGTVLAWVASALIHMLVKYHNADYLPVPNEDEVMAALRNGMPKPGIHSLPYCAEMSDMNKPEVQEKFKRGPVAMIAVFPSGLPNMGKLMTQQVGFFLAGCVLIAYCAAQVLAAGSGFLAVFRLTSSVGFLAFGWAMIPMSIWYGHPWPNTVRYLVDALVYGLVIGVSFAWLWPA
jgi:hypothetical protein